MRKSKLKQELYEVEAKLDNLNLVHAAEVKEADFDGYNRGFNQAMQLFRQERKEIFKFAALTAVGNAKHSTKLLEKVSQSLTDSVDEDIDDKVVYRSSY